MTRSYIILSLSSQSNLFIKKVLFYFTVIGFGCHLLTSCGFRPTDSITDGIYDDTLVYQDDSNYYDRYYHKEDRVIFPNTYDYSSFFKSKSKEYRKIITDSVSVLDDWEFKSNAIPEHRKRIRARRRPYPRFSLGFGFSSPWWGSHYGAYPYYGGYYPHWSYDFYSYYNFFDPWYYNNFYWNYGSFYNSYPFYPRYYTTTNHFSNNTSIPYVRNGRDYETKYNVGRKISDPLPSPTNYNKYSSHYNQGRRYSQERNNYKSSYQNNRHRNNTNQNTHQNSYTPRVRSSR